MLIKGRKIKEYPSSSKQKAPLSTFVNIRKYSTKTKQEEDQNFELVKLSKEDS